MTTHRPTNEPRPGDDDAPEISARLLRLLLALGGRMIGHFSARAAELGLSPGQGKVLLNLPPGEALPMRALARRLHYDASNLTSLVDRLEDMALVERRTDPGDRRARAVAATDSGRRLRERLRHRLTVGVAPVGELSEEQLAALEALLAAALPDVD